MAASGKAVVRDSGLRGILASGLAAIFDASDECADCCGSVCTSGAPSLEMTISWDDTPGSTPTGVNYSAGPPSTIELFLDVENAPNKITWENGVSQQMCPEYYWFGGPNATTATTYGTPTGTPGTWPPNTTINTSNIAMWAVGEPGPGRGPSIRFSARKLLDTVINYHDRRIKERVTVADSTGAIPKFSWFATQVFTASKAYYPPIASSTAMANLTGTPSYTGGVVGTTSWNANLFGQFGGMMKTANGLTLTWQKGSGPWP